MAIPPETTPPAPHKPTRESAEQDGFLREVDEALREQQMQDVAKKYGLPIGIALVLILGGVGGYLWWDGKSTAENDDRGERLTLALDRAQANNLDSAETMLGELAGEEAAGTAALARLTQAGLAAQAGDAERAAEIYAAVAADADAPQQLRDLAIVRDVALRFDDMPPEQVIERLQPLAVSGNAWFGSAGEMVAIAYMKQDKNDEAGALLADISRDEEVPNTIRRRTRQLAGLLGVDAIDDVERVLDESELAARGRNAPQQ